MDNGQHPRRHRYGEAVTLRRRDIIYVDESKARGYIMVATAIAPAEVREAERALRAMLRPGQRRIHFKSESDPRRRSVLSTMVGLPLRCSIWVVDGLPDTLARPRILGALTQAAQDAGAAQLILERDESLEVADRRLSAAVTASHTSDLRYRHAAPHEHPMLWVSDAVAWCQYRGGAWAERSKSIVHQIERLSTRVSLARHTVRKTARLRGRRPAAGSSVLYVRRG